jgi:hypothetical protein
MNFVDCLFIKKNSNLFLFVLCTCILIGVAICFIGASYIFLFFFKKNINNYTVFNEYNASSKMMIDRYGDNKITNAYLLKEPVHIFLLLIYKLLTCQSCEYTKHARHTSLLLEVEINKDEHKLILIDKTNCITILTDFNISDKYTMVPIQLNSKKNLTMRELLDKTCNRIGKRKFFNWHFYKNNCNYFIDNMIKTLNKNFVYDKTFFKSKEENTYMFNNALYNGFRLRVWHCVIFLLDFFTKYIDIVKTYITYSFEKTALRII